MTAQGVDKHSIYFKIKCNIFQTQEPIARQFLSIYFQGLHGKVSHNPLQIRMCHTFKSLIDPLIGFVPRSCDFQLANTAGLPKPLYGRVALKVQHTFKCKKRAYFSIIFWASLIESATFNSWLAN